MKQLILSGGGEAEDTKEIDKLFVGILPKNPKILYIPIAINTEKHPYSDCLIWIKSVLNPLGVKRITMWTDLQNKKINELKSFDAVYIGGGNTFKLLNDFRSTGFDKELLKFINSGGFVYGGSAGAIILSMNIDTSRDVNKVGIKDTSGLDLTNGFQIWCHYTPEDDEKIMNYIGDKSIKVIALSEKSGIYIKDSLIKTLGIDDVFVFSKNNKEKFKPNSVFNNMKYPQTNITYDGKKVVFIWMKGMNFERYSPIRQCYGIVTNKNGEILLQRAADSLEWGLPGGTPEGNETLFETLKRELVEEVDVEVTEAKELGLQKAFEEGKENEAVYQARFLVNRFKLLPQTPDPDGGVMRDRKFFPIKKVNKILKWGPAAEVMFDDAINLWKSIQK